MNSIKLGRNDWSLALAARAGDKSAMTELWARYKPVSMSILGCVKGLDAEEKESEAFLLFSHKLFNVFKPEKVLATRDPNSWTFSFMITGGIKNLRSKLIGRSRRDMSAVSQMSWEESSCEDDGHYSSSRDQINYGAVKDTAVFELYNPERLVISSIEAESVRVKRFYAKLTTFQKQVLAERRLGLKLQEIADKFDCSLSRVKTHLRIAKDVASSVFDVTYA